MNDREHVLRLLREIFSRAEQAKGCTADKEYCMRILDSMQGDLARVKKLLMTGSFD